MMKRYSLLPLYIALIMCLLTCPAQAWVTEALDNMVTGGSNSGYTSIALDSAGAIHISSYNAGMNAMQYSTNASGESSLRTSM